MISNGEDKYNDQLKTYCICKIPINKCDDSFMIQCDLCENWFHGNCINLAEEKSEFVDEFICPLCEKSTKRRTSWKTKCIVCMKEVKRDGSKFCCDECGLVHVRRMLKKANVTIEGVDAEGKDDGLEAEERLLRRREKLVERKEKISKAVLVYNLFFKREVEFCGFDFTLCNNNSFMEISENDFIEILQQDLDKLKETYKNLCWETKCHHIIKTPKSSLEIPAEILSDIHLDEEEIKIPSWAHLLCNSVDFELDVLENETLKQVRKQQRLAEFDKTVCKVSVNGNVLIFEKSGSVVSGGITI